MAAAAAVDPRTPPRHSLDSRVANGDTGSPASSDVGSPTRSSRCAVNAMDFAANGEQMPRIALNVTAWDLLCQGQAPN